VFPLLYVLLGEGLARLWDTRLLSARGAALAGGVALCVLHWQGSHRRWTEEERHHLAPIAGIKRYASQRIEQGKFLRECIDEGLLPKKLNLCVGGAGALPYYTEWVTVDKRGLNDHHVARLPIDEQKGLAHSRNAPHDYLRERQVEVFDVSNQLLYDHDRGAADGDSVPTREGELPLRAVKLKDRFLVFCTFVEDRRLTRKFAPLEVLGAVVKGRQKRPGRGEEEEE